MRLKDVAKVNQRSLSDSVADDYEFQYIDIGSVSLENGIELGNPIPFWDAPSRARRIVKKGDVLVSTVRTYLRAIADIDWDAKDVIASTGFAVYSPNYNVSSRFLAYSVKSTEVINQICSGSKGVSYPAIQEPILSSVSIPYYDMETQNKIADYLDKECGRIGQEIELLVRKADAYRRLRRSIINQAVTRGLNPNVKMVPSGNKWIGDIPEHWTIKRNKDLFFERDCVSDTGEEDLLSVSEYYGVAKRADKVDSENISRAESLVGYKKCFVGDIVMNIMLAWKGSQGRSDYNGIVSPAYGVYAPLGDINTRYFHYLFRSDRYKKIYYAFSKGIIESRLRLYAYIFFGLFSHVPPKEEQDAIVNFIDDKCNKIEAIESKIAEKIEKLKALKRSLINEVVTGQRAII